MIEILRKRRSVRKFTKTPLDEVQIKILEEALLRSPSSRNIDPWQFIFIDDKSLIKKLAASKMHGSSFMAGAPFAVVVIADGKESDVWVEDCSIASIIVQLEAQSLELGSCWVQIRNRMHDRQTTSEEYVKGILNIPQDYRVESIIAIGHPDEFVEPKPIEDLDFTKIKRNGF